MTLPRISVVLLACRQAPFALPLGAPALAPCVRHTLLPLTAGAKHRQRERLLWRSSIPLDGHPRPHARPAARSHSRSAVTASIAPDAWCAVRHPTRRELVYCGDIMERRFRQSVATSDVDVLTDGCAGETVSLPTGAGLAAGTLMISRLGRAVLHLRSLSLPGMHRAERPEDQVGSYIFFLGSNLLFFGRELEIVVNADAPCPSDAANAEFDSNVITRAIASKTLMGRLRQ